MSRPRVAIAHDYLTQRGGAERVVLAMVRAFPGASVHTTLYDPEGTFPEFRDVHVVTSPLDRVKTLRKDHRLALPLLAPVASRITVDADVTVVSSSGWAHGFDIRGRSLVYCHNPARWLYQRDEYLGSTGRFALSRLVLGALGPSLRRVDQRAARHRDRYLANSTVVQNRIRATYGITADVLFPPTTVDVRGSQRPLPGLGDGFHLVVARLLPYKNVDRVVEAFRRLPHDRLVVIGRGPEEQRLRADLPSNVTLRTEVTDEELRWLYSHCVALVAASYEDYGLTPLEAGAFGKPTLALRRGGYLDTIDEGVTGDFFDRPTATAIAAAVDRNRGVRWDAQAIQEHGRRFDEAAFRSGIRAAVAEFG